MVGFRVRKNDNHWKCFANLLEICRIVFSPTISNFDLMNLGDIISDFLQGYKYHFKGRIVYKMHNLVHYPMYIGQLGPLIAVWCMRYEGKRAYFKALQRNIRNFINILWTLSYCHQEWMCSKFANSNGKYLSFEVTFSPKKILNLDQVSYNGQKASLLGLTM